MRWPVYSGGQVRWVVLIVNAMVKSALVLVLASAATRVPIGADQLRLADMALAITLCVAIGVSVFIERFVSQLLAIERVATLREKKYEQFMSLPLRSANQFNRDSLWLGMTSDLSVVKNWTLYGVVPLLCYGSWLAASITALFWVDPVLGIWIVGVSALSLPISWLGVKGVGQAQELTAKARQKVMRQVQKTINSISLIHGANQRNRELRRFYRLHGELAASERHKARAIAKTRGLIESLSFLLLVVICWLAGVRVEVGSISNEQVATLLIVTLYLMPYLRRLLRAREYWEKYGVVQKNTERLLRERRARRSGVRLSSPYGSGVDISLHHPDLCHEMRIACGMRLLWQASFCKDVLHESITAFSQLSRFRIATCRLDGVDYNELSFAEKSRRIFVVDTSHGLVSASLLTNLRYGVRHLQPDDLDNALARFELVDAVRRVEGMSIKHAYQLQAALTTFERFRIELARAYLRKPSLLVLADASWWHEERQRAFFQRVLPLFKCTLIAAVPAGPQTTGGFDKVWPEPEHNYIGVSLGQVVLS